MKLRTRIVGGLLCIFMLTVVIGAGSFHIINRITNIKIDAFQLTELSDTANALVEAHHVWRYNLAWAFLYDRPFVGGLDPHTCIYGRWLEGPMPHMIDDPRVFALIDAVFQPHYDLHVQGGVALRLRAEGNLEAAHDLLYRVVFPAGVESTTRINALRDHYMYLRDYHMEDMYNLIATGNTILVIVSVIALSLFIILSYFITRSILVPVRGIEHVANALSQMNFTIEILKTENDEIGNIQTELISIRDNLKRGIDDMRVSHENDMKIVKEQQLAFAERMHTILDASPMVCAVFNEVGEIIDVNKEVTNMFGISDPKTFITNFEKFLPKHQPDGSDSSTKSHEMLMKAQEEGNARYEWTYLHNNGSLIPTEEILQRINVDGKKHVIAYSRDLTEHYREREKERNIQAKIQVMMEQLDEHVEQQTSSITASSSATEEMIANIRSVTDTLSNNTQNVKHLEEASEAGHTSLNEVAADIQRISRESDSLLEINSVMQNIASQTNLLSMNAAIEAAHAGEAGRGFAVVADEIRKLAESSSKQSKTIGGVLKSIKGSFDKITKSTEVVLGKFNAIGDGVKIVATQEDSILNAMEEQGQGSKQILQAISNVNEVTHQVKEAARRLVETSKETMHKTSDAEYQASTDDVSGARNRDYFFNTGTQELRYCTDENREFNLIMFSIDNLQRVADVHGEDIRGEVLKILCMRVRNSLKQGTLLARYSDDRFIVTLPNVPQGTATKLAEQLMRKIKETPFATKGIKLNVSISIGLAVRTNTSKTIETIINDAGLALTSAQASGSGKIIVAGK